MNLRRSSGRQTPRKLRPDPEWLPETDRCFLPSTGSQRLLHGRCAPRRCSSSLEYRPTHRTRKQWHTKRMSRRSDTIRIHFVRESAGELGRRSYWQLRSGTPVYRIILHLFFVHSWFSYYCLMNILMLLFTLRSIVHREIWSFFINWNEMLFTIVSVLK